MWCTFAGVCDDMCAMNDVSQDMVISVPRNAEIVDNENVKKSALKFMSETRLSDVVSAGDHSQKAATSTALSTTISPEVQEQRAFMDNYGTRIDYHQVADYDGASKGPNKMNFIQAKLKTGQNSITNNKHLAKQASEDYLAPNQLRQRRQQKRKRTKQRIDILKRGRQLRPSFLLQQEVQPETQPEPSEFALSEIPQNGAISQESKLLQQLDGHTQNQILRSGFNFPSHMSTNEPGDATEAMDFGESGM